MRRVLVCFGLVSALTFACACSTSRAGLSSADPPSGSVGDDDAAFLLDLAGFDAGTAADENASVPAPVSIASSASADALAPMGDDESRDVAIDAAPMADAVPDGACSASLQPGDLSIDEILVESVSGAGDYGEWFEVASTLDCVANLRGLHGECPHGSKVATFDVSGDVWIPVGGRFVVADSTDPALNHDLPGAVLGWMGHPGDVLRNKGTTLTLSLGGVIIDTITYPALTFAIGSSLAFPSDCDPSDRTDWKKWQTSTASYFPSFFGTPNAPNDDVTCPYGGGSGGTDAAP